MPRRIDVLVEINRKLYTIQTEIEDMLKIAEKIEMTSVHVSLEGLYNRVKEVRKGILGVIENYKKLQEEVVL